MKNKTAFKAFASVLCGALIGTAAPVLPLSAGAAEGDILVTGFEDGDVSMFSKRGEDDTSVIGISEEEAYEGEKCMAITERSTGWNGATVNVSTLGCEPGVQYLVSAAVKAQWYNTVSISFQLDGFPVYLDSNRRRISRNKLD